MDKMARKSTGIREALVEKSRAIPPIMVDDFQFCIDMSDLTPEMIERAEIELNETPENVTKALAELRELLKSEPDLYISDDDNYFAKFLRPCKWNAKYSFALIKRYFQYQVTHPRICNNLTPSYNHDVIEAGILTPLPGRSRGCRMVVIESGKKWNTKQISVEQIFRGLLVFLNAASCEPITQVSGVHVILDAEGLTLSHATCFTPSFAKAVLEWVQRCLPARLKGVHVVNQPFIFNMVYALFKPFIMEKLRKRLHIHGTNRKTLFAEIDEKSLPSKYGGSWDLPDSLGKHLNRYLSEYEEEFATEDKFGYTTKNKKVSQ